MDSYYVYASTSDVLYVFVVKPQLVNEFETRMRDFTKRALVYHEPRAHRKGYVCIDFPLVADVAFRVIVVDSLEALLHATINYANSMLTHGSTISHVSSVANCISTWVSELGKLVSQTAGALGK